MGIRKFTDDPSLSDAEVATLVSGVGFGNRTTDDLARHWCTFYYMSDAEFQAEVNERTSLKRGTANQQ